MPSQANWNTIEDSNWKEEKEEEKKRKESDEHDYKINTN